VLLAAEVGLDPVAVREVLESEAFAAEVRADEADAQELGVSGVPSSSSTGASASPAPGRRHDSRGIEPGVGQGAPTHVITPDATVACEGDNCTV